MPPQLTTKESPSERPGAAIVSHALRIFAALGAIGVPLLIPHFAAVFRDMDMDNYDPLPLPTVFVLRYYPFMLFLACASAAAAIYLAWRYRTQPIPRLYRLYANGLLVAVIAQAAFTTYALFLPLITLIH